MADSALVAELLIAVNPDDESRLRLLLRVPLAGGDLLFRTSGTWPREKALFAYTASRLRLRPPRSTSGV